MPVFDFTPSFVCKNVDKEIMYWKDASTVYVRPKKKITCVSTNMPKKIRVGRSENLSIFLFNFCLLQKDQKC